MTPPKTKKLFISYRSSDATKVGKIAQNLTSLKYEDGTPRYIIWQDKYNLPPASPNWWDSIIDAIIDCDVFVFHLSRDSLQSSVCRAELDYAHKRNRPIIPIVLDGEFFLKNDKPELPQETWVLVPDYLRGRQFLFYVESEFEKLFQAAISLFESNWPRDLPAPRPLNPDETHEYATNHALYDAACDYAERLAFGEAENLFSMLLNRNDRDYADFAAQWIEIIRKYAELLEIASRRNTQVIFKARLAEYRALFPKPFIAGGIFDPKGIAQLEPVPQKVVGEEAETEPPTRDTKEVERLARDISLHISALAGSSPTEKRQKAKSALIKIGRLAVDPLIDALRDSHLDKGIRAGAAEALGEIGDTRAVEPLIDALKDEDWHVRDNSIEALGKIGDARAIEPLAAALDSHNSMTAAKILAQMGEPTVLPLIAMLKDDSSVAREASAKALGEIGDVRAVEPLIDALKDVHWRVRRYAAESLGKIGDARAVKPLITALRKDENEHVRQCAREALKRIGTPEAEAALTPRWPPFLGPR